MASITARSTVIGENGFSEHEQDANSALTEVDKGLRSTKLGEQCEAIVRFSKLFEKYPFPILINSACLKLAEVFRMGTNFLRVLVLQVMQQNEKHLDKILNIDEFLRRIYSVIHSNDPVARALTLRTLGSIAGVVAERKNIHHSIRSSLDSRDAVEIKAAIFAAERFSSKSKTFASNICTKIAEMIEGLATPMEMKLQLLIVFQQMHHDAETVTLVRQLCLRLLPSYPSATFVEVTLKTLTQLAASSLTSIPEQIDLLLNYLRDDPRRKVQSDVLKNLKCLLRSTPHFFTSENIDSIIIYAIVVPYLDLRVQAVSLLSFLAKSVAVDNFNFSEESPIRDLSRECCFHEDVGLASVSISLLSELAIHDFQENSNTQLMNEVVFAIETSLLLICCEPEQQHSHEEGLRIILKSIVSLCKANSDLCSVLVESVGTLLSNNQGCYTILLCEALCALGSRSPGILINFQPDLMKLLCNIKNERNSKEESKGITLMFTLLFQACLDQPKPLLNLNFIAMTLENLDLWTVFRIARQATRYGHHPTASQIFLNLSNRVSSEHFHFWLTGLAEITQAESNLLQDGELELRLNAAIIHYVKAVAALKAATSPQHLQMFQHEFARLRYEMLQNYLQIIHSCSCLNTSPPPAIAITLAMTTRDDLLKCGRIVTQLRKTAKDFRSLAEQYGNLYQSVFDADPKTLHCLQLLQQSCLILVQGVEQLAQYNQGVNLPNAIEDDSLLQSDHSSLSLENHRMLEACKRASKLIQDFDENIEVKVVGRQKVEHLRNVCKILLGAPLCIPRYFYQSLQSTSIKLAVSPQPKLSGEPVFIQNSSNLVVKVEGIVQHGPHPGLFRKVSKILLVVSSTIQSKVPAILDVKLPQDTGNYMTQVVCLHNDYFQAQFLLSFPAAGLHVVSVQAAVIDDKDSQWTTGPKVTLLVKSHDDGSSQNKQTVQQPGTSRGAFPRF